MFLRLYDFLHTRRRLRLTLLVALLALLAALTATLRYQEDISAFLPLSADHRRAMTLWSNTSASDRIVALFELRDSSDVDTERLQAAVDTFGVKLLEAAGGAMPCAYAPTINYDDLEALTGAIMDYLPLFLTADDYARIDSIISDTAAVRSLLAADREMLLSGMVTEEVEERLQNDPLALFTPVLMRLRRYQTGVHHQLHDGTIFTPDDRKAIAMLTSPYGSSETARNATLVAQIDSAITLTERSMSDVYVHVIGAPTIAVSNATQIKRDSLVALAIAAVLILALLVYTFRNLRSLLLIVGSILFGWLVAMGGISLVHTEVSIIVLGIASVIIGIAVNYPLHYVAHLLHQPSPRAALRELVAPLVIGNVTTVGAFLCLVPLEAPAMRDLGLFSSLMLVGTIAYVLVFLPHQTGLRDLPAAARGQEEASHSAGFIPEAPLKSRRRQWTKRTVGLIFVVITLWLGYHSLSVTFDSDMHHINYMTQAQERDLASFAALQDQAQGVTVYVAATDSSWDSTLDRVARLHTALAPMSRDGQLLSVRSVDDFLPSAAQQRQRATQWSAFWHDSATMRYEALADVIRTQGASVGFRDEAFAPFFSSMLQWGETAHEGLDEESRHLIMAVAFSNYLTHDSTTYTVMTQLQVPNDSVAAVEQAIMRAHPDIFAFDMPTVNSAVADTLSDEFNYIGWACGLIVFLFLWGSFGRLELAVLAFLPMAVSWLWILGVMQLCGLSFNIVNVILATFIFGQGDDYTIFITEGLMYEYAYRRRLLASYKKSILLSALIMFIGIGSLIVARHPALHSLAEVTIVGMSAVILSAWIIPPVVFHLLVRHADGRRRDIPLSLSGLFRPVRRPDHPRSATECQAYIIAKYRYMGLDIERRARRFFSEQPELIADIEAFRAESSNSRFERTVTPDGQSVVHLHDCGQGEAAWLFALLHPDVEVHADDADSELLAIAGSLSCPPPNLHLSTTV